MLSFFLLMLLPAIFLSGYFFGRRAGRRWFMAASAGKGEVASLTYPEVAYRVRRVNAYFFSWMRAAEKCELVKYGKIPDAALQQKARFMLTASIAVAASKLHDEALACMRDQQPEHDDTEFRFGDPRI